MGMNKLTVPAFLPTRTYTDTGLCDSALLDGARAARINLCFFYAPKAILGDGLTWPRSRGILSFPKQLVQRTLGPFFCFLVVLFLEKAV